jgi:hypothetical protein
LQPRNVAIGLHSRLRCLASQVPVTQESLLLPMFVDSRWPPAGLQVPTLCALEVLSVAFELKIPPENYLEITGRCDQARSK